MISQKRKTIFLESILAWGQENRRVFPWREEADAFRILVAELLLQRSRAGTVERVYTKLFDRWPTFIELAEVPLSELEEVIRPLGLGQRAATLKRLAQEIKKKAGVPNSLKELEQLPGIGRYMASATLATAFNTSIPLVDGVTSRVYRRFFGLSGCISPSRYSAPLDKQLWGLVAEIAPENQVHELNWAVLDLAADICLPKVPKCERCPLKSHCVYYGMKGRMRVVELFAGVGGFRLGLEKAGWRVIWSNQWEPSTTRQYASQCYVARFGKDNHVNDDIAEVLDDAYSGKSDLPDHELLVGGFPCQDYSVARTLSHATGIQGKKGVLWWEIHRLLQLKRPPLIFLENVDRLLKSPVHQRGRDFAIMLACLSDLGYLVEWRVVNAADYGFSQKRRRIFIVGQLITREQFRFNPWELLTTNGVLARALPVTLKKLQPTLMIEDAVMADFTVDGDIVAVSDNFGKSTKVSPFHNAGVAFRRNVWTRTATSYYQGKHRLLRDVLQKDEEVDEGFFIPDSQLDEWRYLKGAKREERLHKESGTRYVYAEGGIPFPDDIDQPSRTIVTGEGGSSPSRFKHIIRTHDGRYRRLTPIELERLNGFPDGWTDAGIPDTRRAFLMGNALVVGAVERIGRALADTWCHSAAGL